MDNQQATQFELGWIVGFFEGEGSVGLYWNQARKQIFPVITFVNTDNALIEEAHRILNVLGVGNYVRTHKDNKQKSHWKTRIDIIVSGIKRCQSLISTILPLLNVGTMKRQKALLVLEFCNSRLSNPQPQCGRYTLREHELLDMFRANQSWGVPRDYKPSREVCG